MSRPPTFTPPSGVHAAPLRTERGTFAVLDARPGGTPRGTVLLLPGFTGSKEDFITVLRPLADAGYRAVAVDGRGQYESPGPKEDQTPYEQGELALDVLAQTRAADGAGPFHLLGHSLGGQIARAAAILDPAPFRTLTLMSSGPAEIDPAQQEKTALLAQALGLMTMGEVWDAMQAVETPAPEEPGEAARPAEDPVLEAALRRRWLLHSPAQLIATGRALRAEPDRVAEVRATGLPVHVVSGTQDDTWPVPLLDDMAVRLDAHRTVVEDAGHSPNTDNPQDTAEALVAFWNRFA